MIIFEREKYNIDSCPYFSYILFIITTVMNVRKFIYLKLLQHREKS